jgi:protein CpxP
MNRWIKRSLFAVFGVTLVLAGLSACGHRSHEFGATLSAEEYGEKRMKIVERVSDKLDLTEDQKNRLGLLVDKLHEQRSALMGQTKDPRAEMKSLVAADKFDKARAQALITEKISVLQTGSPGVIAALADLFDSLNPAQQQKLRGYLDGHSRWYRGG